MKQGWEYKKLGELFPYIKNGANIKQSKDAKGYPITRIETLSSGVFNRDRLGYANIYELGKYEEYVLQSHDLLLSHINSKAYIGRTVEYKAKEGETIIHGMNLLRLKSNFDAISSSYFAYYALSTKFKDDIAKIRKDAVNQSSIAISDLKCIKIPVPPLTQQQSIVAELDKINEIIDLKKAQLKDLDLLAQSIFYDMFGDPIENSKGWEVKKLGDNVKIIGGYAFKSKMFANEGIPVLRIGNINSGVFKSTNMVFWEEDSSLKRYEILPGDLVMSLTGTVGKSDYGNVCVLSEEYPKYYLNQRNAKIEIISNIEKYYLAAILKIEEVKSKLTGISRGVRQANISNKDIESLQIPLPPLSLQQSFSSKIQSIESQKSAIKQSLAEVETLLASRMDYWFG